MQSYYVDSCIYLNLWQEEVGENGSPFWEYAKKFFEKAEENHSVIYYSGFLLKELMFILDMDEYLQKRDLFEDSFIFKKVVLSKEEFQLAVLTKKQNMEISLYDIIHIILAKKTNSILITRDRLLMQLAEKFSVIAKKPEEL